MNEESAQRHAAVLNLGTETTIILSDYPGHPGTAMIVGLEHLANSLANVTIDEYNGIIEAVEETKTLTVNFYMQAPSPERNRRIIEPLCRCLSNLRSRNEHHPLRALTLQFADLRIDRLMDVFQLLLDAATKYGGICHVELDNVFGLPIQCLVGFCRNNNSLIFLELNTVIFSDGRAAMSLAPNRTQDSSVMLALDKLVLSEVSFEDPTAVTAFADFISRMTVQALVLGNVYSRYNDEITSRILSDIKFPSMKQLELHRTCRFVHFRAALEAGTTSLTELNVHISYHRSDCMERLELLAHFIRRAVQLNSLRIETLLFCHLPITLPRELIRTIEACATVTRIQVDGDSERGLSRDEVQKLQRITARNEELGRFVACPSTYPTENLLALMRQFKKCPAGRYILARNLPVVFSFDKIKSADSSTTELAEKC